MAKPFNDQFDQYGAWRREFALRLKLLTDWLKDQELLDSAVKDHLQRLEAQVRSDKVTVAFVAEFSRGKSELINAIFFAGYGQRIMPASAGRTTMCPTELGYDPAVPPSLRLLPIETRLQSQSLMEWRMVPEKWTRIDLDVHDPDQLAQAFEQVTQTRRVTQEQAHALGLWQHEDASDNPPVDEQGLVEVPRWRHALVNIAHPLLKQGLVILDTPGLNAIGAEPELTVSLIPQAQAVVFILGADTGVTKSDQTIWRDHLVTETGMTDTRLVVLNKIDTLWDALSTPAQIQAQIDRQCANTAETLGVTRQQVFPVSAQKGLVAKVTKDVALLESSCLPEFEDALAQRILGQQKKILGHVVTAGISRLQTEAGRMLHIRRRDLTEQLIELKGLIGKNATVISQKRLRISRDQIEFDQSGTKIHAVRSMHLKLLRDVFSLLGANSLRDEMALLTTALQQKGLKLGVKKAYGETFGRLRASLQQVQVLIDEIQSMLVATFNQLNAEYGFSLQPAAAPQMLGYFEQLDAVAQNHLQYLGIGNTFRLAQTEFTDRLVRALSTRLRGIHQAALVDVEQWSTAAGAQLDAQLRERRRTFARRMAIVERIQQASGGLDERIAEIQQQISALGHLDKKMLELTTDMMNAVDAKPAPSPPALEPALA